MALHVAWRARNVSRMGIVHRLSLAVQYASDASALPTRQQLRRWAKLALQRDASMTIRVVNGAEGRALNKRFRGKNYATNVLTFVNEDTEILYGDIVICAPVVEKEARTQHKTLLAHYAHLVLHAVLHLQGYDHEDVEDAARMEARETALMAKLGYADPYQAE
ncbi:MAG: rRNA maturation RNase YbeY [Candidatus Nitrotoga sp.]